MTSDEIKKALECCSEHEACRNCPCENECGDLSVVTTEALNLINHQQAEIERLSNERAVHRKIIDDRAEAILQHDAVIRDLHKQLKDVGQIKSEAIKEFGKLLIDNCQNGEISACDILDYVVETVGESNDT